MRDYLDEHWHAAGTNGASGASYDGSRNEVGFVFPTGNVFGIPNSWFGPNFEFTHGCTEARLKLDSFSPRLRFARVGCLAAQIAAKPRSVKKLSSDRSAFWRGPSQALRWRRVDPTCAVF